MDESELDFETILGAVFPVYHPEDHDRFLPVQSTNLFPSEQLDDESLRQAFGKDKPLYDEESGQMVVYEEGWQAIGYLEEEDASRAH